MLLLIVVVAMILLLLFVDAVVCGSLKLSVSEIGTKITIRILEMQLEYVIVCVFVLNFKHENGLTASFTFLFCLA